MYRGMSKKSIPAFVWLFTAHIFLILYSSEFNVGMTVRKLYVVPDNTDTDANLERLCQTAECHSLAYYMNNSCYHSNFSSMYFNSYETYVFWTGVHKPLDHCTVVISNVSNLTLNGRLFNEENQGIGAVIDCHGDSVGFVFKETANITIENLSFTSCVRTYSTLAGANHALATLAFQKGFNVFLKRVRLEDSTDEGIFIQDIQGVIHLKEVVIVNGTSRVWGTMNVIFNRECNDMNLKVIIEDSVFINNSLPKSNHRTNPDTQKTSLAAGLSITLQCLNLNVRIDNVTMKDNAGKHGGNLALVFHNTSSTPNNVVSIQNSVFETGSGDKGGGLYVELIEGSKSEETLCLHSSNKSKHQLLSVKNTVFRRNSAVYAGGAVYLIKKQSKASCSVGLITFLDCKFEWNSVIKPGFGGTALNSLTYPLAGYTHHGTPQFETRIEGCNFQDNFAESLKSPQSGNGAIFTKADTYFHLINVNISNNNSTGVLAIGSNIIFSDSVSITHNRASSGGGMLLCEQSILYFDPNSTLTIEYNHAKHTGGGISVETLCLQSKPMCFFQLNETIAHNNTEALRSIHVYVQNNTAGFAGHNLFGGSVDHCFMLDDPEHHINQYDYGSVVFSTIFHIPNVTVNSSVTSEPRQVCLCQNNSVFCDNRDYLQNLTEYPGKQFTVQAVLTGQLQGIVPGTVQAFLTSSPNTSSLRDKDKVQKLSSISSCDKLTYTMYTNLARVRLELIAQHSGDISGYERLNTYKKLYIDVTMKPCPPGFSLTSNNGRFVCDCHEILIEFGIKCDTENLLIVKPKSSIWVGYYNNTDILFFHMHCPFEYCSREKKLKLSSEEIVLSKTSLLKQNKQCAQNRTGVLCGQCIYGHSLTLGSLHCQVCSNYWLFLIILIALSGVLVVFTLTVLNITITEGNLSGILFFCNIVNIDVTFFFPPKCYIPFITPLLKTFVSTLSLTLGGLSVCLYDGLDAYALAWLSFIYPFYIWILAGLLICMGNKFNWLVRHNSVRVLATLIILSYSSLLCSVIDAIQATRMHHDKGTGEYVWLQDGNIKFFQGKHIPLGIFSALLGLLLLPFTFSLLCIKSLHKVSHYWVFSWVDRLKPFLDAYTGPFTPRARFWTGLLLLARVILYTSSAVNLTNSRQASLGAVILMSFILLSVALPHKAKLYKKVSLNILELALLINLGLLSTVSISVDDAVSLKVFINLSVGATFIAFVGVMVCSTKLKRLIEIPVKYVRLCLMEKCSKFKRSDYQSDIEDESDQVMAAMFPPYVPFNEAREPLLD